MYKVYFNDAEIGFSSENEDKTSENRESVSVGADSPLPITKVLQKLQFTKSLTIISPDPQSSFKQFASQLERIDAGGGVVRNLSDDVLMIHRNGRWDLPKGKREAGEEIGACALREVIEECGVGALTLGEFLTDTYHIYSLHDKLILKRTTWFEMHCTSDKPLVPQAEEGITSALWVALKDIPEKMTQSYKTIRDVLEIALNKD